MIDKLFILFLVFTVISCNQNQKRLIEDDEMKEDIPIVENHVPLEFVHENGKLVGMRFEKVQPEYDNSGKRRLVPTGEEPVFFECDEVLLAIGQQNAFPWIEEDCGIAFNDYGLPELHPVTLQSSLPSVFFGGDAAFGPGNIIIAVAHGHQAAISIDLFCRGENIHERPEPQIREFGAIPWASVGRGTIPNSLKLKLLFSRLA